MSSTLIDFKLANAVLPQTEEKFLVSEQGITLAFAHNFQILKNSQFNECFMCYLHSLQTLSSTQSNNYSSDYKVSYRVSHWDDRNENLLISTLRIPENSHSAFHWVPPFSGAEIPTSWQRGRIRVLAM